MRPQRSLSNGGLRGHVHERRPVGPSLATQASSGSPSACGTVVQVRQRAPSDLRITRAARLGALAVFVLVADDIHDVSVWRTDKEPAHPPWLRSQRMNDLEATSPRLLIRGLNLIADMNRDD